MQKQQREEQKAEEYRMQQQLLADQIRWAPVDAEDENHMIREGKKNKKKQEQEAKKKEKRDIQMMDEAMVE